MSTGRFSFPDVVMVACVGLLVLALSSMQIQRHRAAARKSSCVDNLFQLVLATHNYHSAFKQLPMGSGGTTGGPNSKDWQSNQDRLSAFVALTPFHDETAFWEQVVNPQRINEIAFPSMGPVPWYDPQVYTPWGRRPKIMACPADGDALEFSTVSSYVMNYGDAVHLVGAPHDPQDETNAEAITATSRGVFASKQLLKFRSILDGLSNTLMFSESCIAGIPVAKEVDGLSLKPSLCVAAQNDPTTQYWPRGREACWADGCLRSSGFQTILPPNAPSATSKDSDLGGILSASSHHVDGVHVAMADGAIRFVSDSIDAGESDAPTVALLPNTKHAKPKSKSPYGLWGALGTRASMEVIQRGHERLQTPLPVVTENEIEAIKRKPEQVWKRAGTGSEIRGQVIAVVDRSLIYWSAEENDVLQIPLTKLAPNDVAQVQQYYDKLLDRVELQLKVQITKATRSLNDNQVSDFCDAIMNSDTLDRPQLETLVRRNRDQLARILEELVEGINDPESRIFSRQMTADAPITIRLSKISRLKDTDFALRYIDGRWAIHVH